MLLLRSHSLCHSHACHSNTSAPYEALDRCRCAANFRDAHKLKRHSLINTDVIVVHALAVLRLCR